MDDDLLAWLLDGDPAVRWRVLRDFTGAGEEEVARERERIAAEGWGARLLAEQRADGGWGEGDYSPKWTSTTYTMLHLLWLGLPARHAAVLRGCARLWEWQTRWRTPETCIAGMLIRLTSAFRYNAERLDGLVGHLIGEQLDDGGWNCKSRGDKSMHSSFHTSIQALEALDAYRRAGGTVEADAAIGRGHEFFLRHRLYQSHRTGAVAIPASTKFPVFPEWHFDVLRGLEHFAHTEAPRDDRLGDAIGLVRRAQRRDRRWSTYTGYAGKQFFRLEEPGPSRLNTVRALHVLQWWEAS